MIKLQTLTRDVLACTACSDIDEVMVNEGKKNERIKLTPRVKITKGAINLVESSRLPVPGHNLGGDQISVKYLWVGEAPGADEDDQGEGFVGRSGQRLRTLIRHTARIKLNECRFSNIVKCHPLNNRDPYLSEIRECSKWLLEEIRLTQPEVIFAVGKFATQFFVGGRGVGLKSGHGQLYDWELDGEKYKVMPLYHPAGINRAVTKEVMDRDFRGIREKIRTTEKAPSETFLVKNHHDLQEVLDEIEGYDDIGLDIETNETERSRKGKRPDPLTNRLAGIALAWGDKAAYIPLCDHPDRLMRYKDFSRNSWGELTNDVMFALRSFLNQKTIFIHNAKFEIESFNKYDYHPEEDNEIFDTMLAAYALRNETVGLKDVVKRNLGVSMTLFEEVVGNKAVSEIPLADIYPYAGDDARYCLKYGIQAREEMKEQGVEEFYREVLMGLLPWVIEVELTGLRIDLEKRDEIRPYFANEVQRLVEEAHEIYRDFIIEEMRSVSTLPEWGTNTHQFNLNSAEQKSQILFQEMGLTKTKPTDGTRRNPSKDQYMTVASELEKIAHEHPLVSVLIKHGSASTILNTFIDGADKWINPHTGRAHPSVNQTASRTSRLSYNGPNAQNIPVRDEESKELRKIFIPDDDGIWVQDANGQWVLTKEEDGEWWVWSIDQSQIELRVACHYCQDPRMLHFFNNGLSIHKETCRNIYGIEEGNTLWEPSYKKSKNGNFGALYLVGPETLASTFESDLDTAREFLKEHRRLYPGWYTWVEEQKKRVKIKGYAETMFGFKRYIYELRSSSKSMREAGARLAVNLPIQGTSAGIIQLAMGHIHTWMKKKQFRGRMAFQVHDELNGFSPESEVIETVKGVSKRLEYGVVLSVPTPVEAKVGRNWGEIEDFDKWVKNRKELVEV